MNLKLEYDSFQDFANRLWPCLSEEGMWVPSEHSASVGELVDFDVTLADGFRLFHGTGQVIDVGSGPEGGPGGQGMTIRFGQLDQPSRNLVRKVVSKHIGEGGKIFVLSSPAAKVGVLGGEEDSEPTVEAGVEDPAMGPEDLVAPFPEFESGSGWSDDSEPQLTSFLRPGNGPTALEDEETGELHQLDSLLDSADAAASGTSEPEEPGTLPSEPPAAEPPTAEPPTAEPPTAATPDTEPPVTEPPAPEPPMPEASTPEELAPEPPDLEPSSEIPQAAEKKHSGLTHSELSAQFERSLAESEPMEPSPIVASFDSDQDLFAAPQPDVEPLPSTVLPPQTGEFDFDTATDDGYDAGFEGQDLDDEGAESADGPSRRAWWPYALIALIAVAAGLFVASRFDTPLSQWIGGATTVEGEAGGVETAVGDAGGEEPGAIASTPGTDGEPGVDDVGEESSGDAVDSRADLATDPGSAEEPTESDSGPDTAVAGVDAGETTAAAEPVTQDPAPAPAPPAAAAGTPVAPTVDSSADPAADSILTPVRLTRVTWSTVEGDTAIRLWLDGDVSADRLQTERIEAGSPRAVVKVSGIEGTVPGGPIPIGSEHVDQLRFGIHPGVGGRQLHVVADLVDAEVDLIGSVGVDEGGLVLRFGRP